jgi:hypothetical protein
MRALIILSATVTILTHAGAQNVGIGGDNSGRAKLEVLGVLGLGKTAGYFGDYNGISLQRNYPAIGMNQYRDNTQYGRYMGNGWAAVWEFVHDDATQAKGLSLSVSPSGSADAVIPSANKLWEFSINNRLRIQTTGSGVNGILDVGRGTGGDGTAMFAGTNYSSHFNYSTSEHTYIRGGKSSSHVYINDITNGNVVFGNGTCTVGINTNGYVPPTTLEVRQSNGGMELSNASYTNLPMEWRVASGSNANFYLYYANSVRTYFSYSDGSLHPISDARIKTNILPLPAVLDNIMQLQPVSYMMKDAAEGHGRSMGFLAQNVQKLFPLLVATSMNDSDLLGLNYAGFNVIAVKGIQEEQLQINTLDKDLADIERRLKVVEQKQVNQNQ